MKINKVQTNRVTNALLRKAGNTYRVVSMLMLLLVISFIVKANPIDENAARQVGAQFVNRSLSLRTTADALNLAATYSTDDGTVAFRVFKHGKRLCHQKKSL